MRQLLGGRGEAGLVLDRIEFGDLIERHLGDGRLGRFPHVEYFSAAMAPAGNLGNCRHCREPWTSLPRLVERLEPAIGIGLQEAGEVREMGRWMLAAAVRAVEVDRRRRRRTAEWPVIADIDP